jgi:hypothetical protein
MIVLDLLRVQENKSVDKLQEARTVSLKSSTVFSTPILKFKQCRWRVGGAGTKSAAFFLYALQRVA